MTLQARLLAFVQAVGADVKALQTNQTKSIQLSKTAAVPAGLPAGTIIFRTTT